MVPRTRIALSTTGITPGRYEEAAFNRVLSMAGWLTTVLSALTSSSSRLP
ncbi:hypothetical protein LIA77_08547 [Sarocladium implicatum]|nr:hypothetical protein LIA77_08547 [Sarocladium implicatum]